MPPPADGKAGRNKSDEQSPTQCKIRAKSWPATCELHSKWTPAGGRRRVSGTCVALRWPVLVPIAGAGRGCSLTSERSTVIHAQAAIAIVIGLAAAIEDIARRRISNWIPITAFVAGVICLAWNRGWSGAGSAIGGAGAGFVVFLVFYCLGGMGGGDVKLMAGLGAVVGIERVLPAALWTAACGGVLAAICLAVPAIRSLGARRPNPQAPVKSIPYAPAIAVGMWLALLPG